METAYRKPTELLALSGAFEKDPQRRRPVGPKSPHPIGDPPACLAPDEAAAWRGFVGDAPLGRGRDARAAGGLGRGPAALLAQVVGLAAR